jgi:ribosomal protein L7/L12
MPRLRLKSWTPDANDLFDQRVMMMKVLVENTKLGLRISKDIADGLLESKEASIEVDDLEKADSFAQKLKDLGVSVEIERD